MKMMTMIMTTNFSEIKKQGRIKGFKIWGWERNKVFWPEYLPLVLGDELATWTKSQK